MGDKIDSASFSGPRGMVPDIDIAPTIDDFETSAARAALAVIMAALDERHGCLIALSGGSTPRGVYRRLAGFLASQSVDLSRVHIVFVDERMVPPSDSESNYGMIRRELISHIDIPPSNVYRIKGEAMPDAAARDYECQLQTILPRFADRCDLTLLGVGEDGHTASLFPGTEVLREMRHKARAVFVPRLNSWRVTLTLPLINFSRTVFFLVAGKHKAAIVGEIFEDYRSRENIPATLIKPDPGTITWRLDAEAASRIPPDRLRVPGPASPGRASDE